MNQIGFEQEWLYILREYVKPYNQKIFTGYYTDVRISWSFRVCSVYVL